MMEICDVKEEQLPKLYESWEVVGTLKPEVAKGTWFLRRCQVVAGAGDNAAAAVGTGTVGDGQCNISLGTSGTIFISSKNFGVDEIMHCILSVMQMELSSDGLHAECSIL